MTADKLSATLSPSGLVPLTHSRIRDLETRLESARFLAATLADYSDAALRLHPPGYHLPCRMHGDCPTRIALTEPDEDGVA